MSNEKLEHSNKARSHRRILTFIQESRIERKITQSFINPEDLALNKVAEPIFNDPDVERVRRAHRNDLENILPYLLIALAYTATGPNALVARLLFRFVSLSRIVHTIVYAFRPVPQPTRAIAFFLSFGITMFMAFYVMIKLITYI